MSIKNNLVFNIDIDGIKKNEEEKLQKKIEEIKEPSLSYTEKRILCLNKEKTFTNTIDNPYIDIKKIRDERNNIIEEKMKEIKDPNLTDEQKRILVIKQEKTTSYIFVEKSNDKENNKSIVEESISNSTGRDSSLDVVEFNDYDSDAPIKKNKKKIDVETIRDEYENNIQEKMKKINDINLNDFEKRLLVIKEDKTTVLKTKKFYKFENIDIQGINKENIDNFKEKINKKNEPYLTEYQKTKKQLIEDKTSTELNYSNDNSTYISLNITSSLEMSKTRDDTNINDTFSSISEGNNTIKVSPSNNKSEDKIIQDNLIKDESQEQDKCENQFNKSKINFYRKHNLFDVLLNPTNKAIKLPRKYNINEQYYFFVYPNDLCTYYITKSGYIKNYINDNQDFINIEKNGSIYDETLGLFFCGKSIEIKGKIGQELKKCEPNNFICKECMQLNKAKYKLKNNYLINIKGRVAKVSKGSYHCYGHYSCDKQIEDCITNFSCQACKMLDTNSSYYV